MQFNSNNPIGRLAYQNSKRWCGRPLPESCHADHPVDAEPDREKGLTLVELIVTVAILAILASAVVPMARLEVKREKEHELRYELWQIRDAIDHYKDLADRGAFQIRVD